MIGREMKWSGRGWQGLATLGVALALAAPSAAADTPAKPVTFSKDVAPIFQAKCQECHQPNSIAPMSLITYQEARPWARSIKERVATRQMPPWHIDRSVGVQQVQERHVAERRADRHDRPLGRQRRAAGRSEGHAAAQAARHRQRVEGRARRLRSARSGRRSRRSTRCRPQHQDVWCRPMSDIPLTEPRWVRMVEIRPTNLKARKIVHHSIAYLVLNNDPEAVNTGTASGPERGGDADDLVNRRPQLMEWAIGKGYDLFRPGTGKLLVPGEKISWDQHIHAVGEEVTGGSEIGIWFYPKGQEPKKRSYLIGFTGIDRSARRSTSRRTRWRRPKASRC